MLTVMCVLRSGGDFTPGYVHVLRDSVARHLSLPHRFVCLTDLKSEEFQGVDVIPLRHNWPGWWSKMELFAHPGADRLFLDLDTVVCGSINDLPTKANDQFTCLEDFYRGPGAYGSGLMFLPQGWGLFLYSAFASAAEEHISRFRGDQDFLEVHRPKAQTWTQVGLQAPRGTKIVSFKPVPLFQGNGKPVTLSKMPKPAPSVICFHGNPRPAHLPGNHWIRGHWRRESWDEHLGLTGTEDL